MGKKSLLGTCENKKKGAHINGFENISLLGKCEKKKKIYGKQKHVKRKISLSQKRRKTVFTNTVVSFVMKA